MTVTNHTVIRLQCLPTTVLLAAVTILALAAGLDATGGTTEGLLLLLLLLLLAVHRTERPDGFLTMFKACLLLKR